MASETDTPSAQSGKGMESQRASGMSLRFRGRLAIGGTVAVVGLGLAWLLLAWRAGTFIQDRAAFAVSRDDPKIEAFSQRKQLINVGHWQVAYIDEGEGEPVFLLHGCPFQAFEWRDVIPRLTPKYRVIAPDLIGMGDTRVRLDDDYGVRRNEDMVVGLMDALGIHKAYFVGHDHGGATVQLLMAHNPERIRKAVLTNAEAYDEWPSKPERPYLKLVVSRAFSPLFLFALEFIGPVQHEVFSIAVHRQEAFTDEVLAAYTRAHLSTPARRQRLIRFFRYQLDPENNAATMEAVEGMRRFDRPTLLLWGKLDTNFGPAIAERLAADIPGAVGVQWMEQSAHMPMQEEPEAYANALLDFFAAEDSSGPRGGAGVGDAGPP